MKYMFTINCQRNTTTQIISKIDFFLIYKINIILIRYVYIYIIVQTLLLFYSRWV